MVNAPRMMQERRAIQIKEIQASIEKLIKSKKPFDMEILIISTMANLNLSRRTAADYVYVALYNLGIDDVKKKSKNKAL